MNLSVELIAEIRMLGLDVPSVPDFDPDHIAFPNGYIVIKPEKIPGNHRPGYTSWVTSYLGSDEKSDAPAVYVYFKDATWWYGVSEYIPGPGPGDFQRSVGGESELLEKLRHYFFTPNADFYPD